MAASLWDGSAADSTAAPEPMLDQTHSAWWTFLGATSAAVVNLGPIILDDAGQRVRRWVLVIHVPDTSEPLSCLQGVVHESDTQSIWATGERFRVHLRPAFDMPWGDVATEGDIIARVEGLD